MRRFVDRSFPPQSLESDAAELMRAAGPTPDTPEVKQRVRERLMVARVRPRTRLVLAPATILLVLAIGTGAGATLGVRWWRASHEPPRPAPAAVLPAPATAPRAMPIARIDLPAPPDESEAAAPARAPERVTAHPRRARPAGEDGETALLFAATRALRRDRDPVRAGALLDDYFRRYPHGTLAEEALAVAIEAASTRGDVRAHALARRYLARYPNGHFRNAVERALAGPAE